MAAHRRPRALPATPNLAAASASTHATAWWGPRRRPRLGGRWGEGSGGPRPGPASRDGSGGVFWGAAGEGSVTGPANAQDKVDREPAARPRDPRSRLAAGPSRGGRGAQPEPPRGSRRETRKPSRSTPLPELLTGPPAPNLPGPTAVEPGRRPSPPPSTRPTYRRRRPTAATPSRKKPGGAQKPAGRAGKGSWVGDPRSPTAERA